MMYDYNEIHDAAMMAKKMEDLVNTDKVHGFMAQLNRFDCGVPIAFEDYGAAFIAIMSYRGTSGLLDCINRALETFERKVAE